MPPVGQSVEYVATGDALARGRNRAAMLPDLLVEARRVVNTVIAGWHGRRRRGIGEDFWQFRPYVEGESLARIDWRRSARDDHQFVRDREWQTSHTVWLWADPSPSMLYQSSAASVSKESRALVLMLAFAELLARSGERIGCPGVCDPFVSRNGAERLAASLAHARPVQNLPETLAIKGFSDVIIASDFLEPVEDTLAFIDALASRGVRGHLIEIADPAEEEYPYAGRTEFRDPESGERMVAGRAETFAADYRNLYRARREELRLHASRLDWTYVVNRTDRLASEALVAVHLRMTATHGYRARAGR
jgi:uncharacterized protein (DUF58 family)